MAQDYSPLNSYASTEKTRNQIWKISIALIIILSMPVLIYKGFAESPHDAGTPNISQAQRPGSGAATSTFQIDQRLEDITLMSPLGQYQFGLEESGRLALIDRWSNKTVFSSDTAMYLNVTWSTTLRPDGVLEVSWRHESEWPAYGVAWNSNLLLDCRPAELIDRSKRETSDPILQLFDNGLLQIRTEDEILCTINRPAEDKGRLAISYTGFLRTYLKTCDTHMANVISQWTGSKGVDVHIFTYDEDIYNDGTEFQDEPITYDTVYNHLKACFGDHLKTFSFVPISATAQNAAALPQDIVNRCSGPHIDRLLSQYNAIYQTGQQIQNYMLHNAIQYDYILRFRPDILVTEAPQLQVLDHGKVVNIRATYDLMYWGLHHDGSMHTGFTDIAAYGRASTMWTYFNIHNGLQAMLSAQPIWDWSDVLEIDHDRNNLGGNNRCDAEGILGYWLALNGLELETDWRWKMGILRRDGHVSQGFFTCQPWLEANWLCPPETIWK